MNVSRCPRLPLDGSEFCRPVEGRVCRARRVKSGKVCGVINVRARSCVFEAWWKLACDVVQVGFSVRVRALAFEAVQWI